MSSDLNLYCKVMDHVAALEGEHPAHETLEIKETSHSSNLPMWLGIFGGTVTALLIGAFKYL